MCVSEEREKENEDNGWITEEESIYYQHLHLYLSFITGYRILFVISSLIVVEQGHIWLNNISRAVMMMKARIDVDFYFN